MMSAIRHLSSVDNAITVITDSRFAHSAAGSAVSTILAGSAVMLTALTTLGFGRKLLRVITSNKALVIKICLVMPFPGSPIISR